MTRCKIEGILEVMEETQYLYLTTLGRKTGLPREIEIWFVALNNKYYVMAEHRENAQWVKNIRHNPRVHVRVGACEFDATARVLDRERDRQASEQARQLDKRKYGWGGGLPVEIMPDKA